MFLRYVSWRLVLLSGVLAIAGLSCSRALAEEDLLKPMEGSWERRVPNPAGLVFRIVKEVHGSDSVVSMYDDVGKLVESHKSQIKAEKRGPVLVLTFSKIEVTEGPRKGVVEEAPRSYIYRIEGDVFVEAWGLLEGDRMRPEIIFWKRLQPAQ